MNKNLILCIAGIAVGFLVGFYAANVISQPEAQSKSRRTTTAADGSGQLAPSEQSGQLPPNHPDISGMGGGGAPASTSGEAQAAMEAADREPQDFDAQLEAGELFYLMKDFENAELYLTRALKLKPDNFEALVLMGNTKYDDKDYAGAASFYERALNVNANDQNVRTDYGNTFLFREPPDLDRAIEEYRKSLAVSESHANTGYFLASAQIRKKDKAAALETISRLESLNPQHPGLTNLRQDAEAIQ
jgi:tetratricopeptide (TPR) repeat protein